MSTQTSLFGDEPLVPAARSETTPALKTAPLAERMRPRTLPEFAGPPELIGPASLLGRAIRSGQVPSLIFWGPPGSGKTTLARILAAHVKARYLDFSAVTSGVKEIRAVLEEARSLHRQGHRTLVFVDEIHRFNRAQQDVFLPFVEAGDIILAGATTENPSFEINGALLSRTRVIVLPPIDSDRLEGLIDRALSDLERGLAGAFSLAPEARAWLARFADGDARRALNALEAVASHALPGTSVDVPLLESLLQKKFLLYDKSGEEHYNLISALHKSIRDSDVDAGIYWLARMLEGGEDPLYIARRLVRFATEDVGLADPAALRIALAGKDTVHFIGMPEGALALTQVVIYLALAPKSNAIYLAYGAAVADVKKYPNEPPPLSILNAPTRLMKDLGYGAGYVYAHDTPGGVAGLSCLPDSLSGHRYYEPGDRGTEAKFKEKLEALRQLRERKTKT